MKVALMALFLGLYTWSPVIACKAPCTDGKNNDTTALLQEMTREFEARLRAQDQTLVLDPSNLTVYESEEAIDLGFDASAYLPAGFDPLAGKIASYDLPELIEVEDLEEADFDLGFDPALYLPHGFDPFRGMELSR
jgi:hypothetical protein